MSCPDLMVAIYRDLDRIFRRQDKLLSQVQTSSDRFMSLNQLLDSITAEPTGGQPPRTLYDLIFASSSSIESDDIAAPEVDLPKYKYSPLSSTRHTRCLILEPATDRSAELCCSLIEIWLDDPDIIKEDGQLGFLALSYVWGAKTGTRPIKCDGMSLLVTPNCELALRYLRHPDAWRVLWVDALVIDQENIAERSQQVALMPDIYRRAGMVCIWLGEGTETSRTFFRLSKDAADNPGKLKLPASIAKVIFNGSEDQELPLSQLSDTPGLAGMVRLLQLHESWRVATGSDMNELRSRDVKSILEAEWYSRVWTQQEYALAKTVVVKFGDESMGWTPFVQMVDSLLQNFHRPVMTGSISATYRRWQARQLAIIVFRNVETMLKYRGFITAAQQATLLATCVFISRLESCSDLRDKVYGHYGALSPAIPQLPAIDYTKSVEAVYEEFTRSTITATKRFWPATMYYWRVELGSPYPSWVPDMNCTSDVNTNYMIHEREVAKAWRQPEVDGGDDEDDEDGNDDEDEEEAESGAREGEEGEDDEDEADEVGEDSEDEVEDENRKKKGEEGRQGRDEEEAQRATQDVIIDSSVEQRRGTIAIRGVRYAAVVAKDMAWSVKFSSCGQILIRLISWMGVCLDLFASGPTPAPPTTDDDQPLWELREIFAMVRSANQRDTFRSQFSNIIDWYVDCFQEEAQVAQEGPEKLLSTLEKAFEADPYRQAFLRDLLPLEGSILFSTSDNSIGVTTAEVEPGDTIALLTGSNWPVILRPQGDDWRCIGASHIPSIMASEFWPPHKETDDLETFMLV